jgi:hypothetical protein
MSHWDYRTNEIVRMETKECENYPGWEIIDCGCCAGLKWRNR